MGKLWVWWVLSVSLLVAAGCGSGASSPGSPEWTNGSRLRARVFQTDDGAKQWIAWRDTERDEDCYFAPTADSELHCLPGDAAFADIFADSACAQPMMVASLACGALPYAWHIDAPCDVGYTLHRRGARLEPQPTAYYFRDYDGSCVGGSPTEPTVVEYFALAPAEDLAAFVSAELVHESNGPVDNERLVATDGARQLTGSVYDPQSGASMYMTWNPGDVVRWVPAMLGGAYFSDGACADPVGCSGPVDCGRESTLAPYVAHGTFDDTCQQWQISFFEAGAPATEHSQDDGAQCLAVEPTLTCVAAGDPVPADTFAPHMVVDLAAGRIRARYDAVEGGGATGAVWFYFHDSELDVDCYPLTAIDGSFRCLPSFFIPYANLFEDAACTIPAAYRDSPQDPCYPFPTPTLATWREPDTTPCAGGHFSDAPRRTYRVGDVLSFAETAALFTTETSGACEPYDAAALPGEVRALTEMAPEEFVAVSELVE